MASGSSVTHVSQSPLAERWDGARWQLLAPPLPFGAPHHRDDPCVRRHVAERFEPIEDFAEQVAELGALGFVEVAEKFLVVRVHSGDRPHRRSPSLGCELDQQGSAVSRIPYPPDVPQSFEPPQGLCDAARRLNHERLEHRRVKDGTCEEQRAKYGFLRAGGRPGGRLRLEGAIVQPREAAQPCPKLFHAGILFAGVLTHQVAVSGAPHEQGGGSHDWTDAEDLEKVGSPGVDQLDDLGFVGSDLGAQVSSACGSSA